MSTDPSDEYRRDLTPVDQDGHALGRVDIRLSEDYVDAERAAAIIEKHLEDAQEELLVELFDADPQAAQLRRE